MESLILFIIIAAISIIFQSAKQGGSRDRQQTAAPKDNRTSMQHTVAPHRSPGNQSTISNMTKPNPIPVRMKSAEVVEPPDMEGIQTEGPKEDISIEKSVVREPVKESGILDIGMDELQRSIIMTEVLGKPKALRKNSR